MKIIFEFAGGSRDGQTEVGDTDRPPVSGNMACAYYLMTEHGTVGKRFWEATPYAMKQLQSPDLPDDGNAEKYEIIERLDASDTGEVLIRCKFIGYA